MQIILRLLRLCSPMEDGKECHKVKDQEIEERVRLLTSQFGNLGVNNFVQNQHVILLF
jgi:hypothetical protein